MTEAATTPRGGDYHWPFLVERVNPPGYWDWRGALDVLLPGLALMTAATVLIRRQEASLRRRGFLPPAGTGPKNIGMAHLALLGALSRFALFLILLLPAGVRRARWDWLACVPTAFEVLLHIYHWDDTGAAFKKAFFGHHLCGLLVLWPCYRYVRACMRG